MTCPLCKQPIGAEMVVYKDGYYLHWECFKKAADILIKKKAKGKEAA